MKLLRFFVILSLMLIAFETVAIAAPYINLNLKYDGANHKYNAEEVYLVINDKQINNLEVPPIIINGNTLVPAREVFEALDAVVDWNDASREVLVSYNHSLVILKIDSNIASVDDKQAVMNVAPKIINNKTMIPLRFVSESLGLSVGWDSKTRIATVKDIIITTTELTTHTTTEITTKTTTETTTKVTTEITTETTTKSTTQTTTKTQLSTQTTTQAAQNNINGSSSITAGNYSKTYINSLTIADNGGNNFKINASSEISDVSVEELPDGRLIVDIKNAENKVNQSSYTISHPYVTEIRVAQNQSNPIMITRVVFDLIDNAQYHVSMTNDRKSIILSLGENNIENIGFTKSGENEILTITGDTSPAVNSFKLTEPNRLVIDLPFSKLTIKENSFFGFNIISGGRYAQFDDNTVRVVLDLNENINYNISSVANSTIVTISESSFKNISYDNKNRKFAITKKEGLNVDINSVVHTDDYNNLNYTLAFNGNYAGLLGNGQFDVNDSYINSVNVETVNGITNFKINEKKILAYTVTEDADFIYINALLPKEKYKNVIVFDAGHGAHDNGASANGLHEKNLTLDIVNKILALFEQDDSIKAYSSRTTDVYPSFNDRTDLANEVGDAFISVHINSAGTNTTAKGTEVYHLNANTTSSGLTSSILASTIQNNLINYLGSTNRGIKSENFIVLRQTNVPAVLCEIGFITNPTEAANMGSDSYRQKTAQAIYDSVKTLFERYPNAR